MKKFEDVWKEANKEGDLKYDPRGTLAWGVIFKEALKKRIEPLLEKQQPEIPEFVATEIEAKKHIYRDFRRIANITHYSEDVRYWYYAKPYHAELFYRAILDGYTVKEKRFYLKNKLTGGYIEQDCYNGTRETYNRHDRTDLTQKEIDSMETGSYEQFEVEEE